MIIGTVDTNVLMVLAVIAAVLGLQAAPFSQSQSRHTCQAPFDIEESMVYISNRKFSWSRDREMPPIIAYMGENSC